VQLGAPLGRSKERMKKSEPRNKRQCVRRNKAEKKTMLALMLMPFSSFDSPLSFSLPFFLL
jgi:hypothetical protein